MDIYVLEATAHKQLLCFCKSTIMENYAPGCFEFLIAGDIELTSDQFDNLMMPAFYDIKKVEKNGWVYFQVDSDEYTYSCEPPGIQMTFNKEATFQKAKQIADKIVQNLNRAGFTAELLVIDNSKITRFELK